MDFKKIGIDQIEDIFVDRVSTQIIDGSKRFSSQILAPSIKHKNALSQDAMFIGAADSAFGSSGSLDGVVYMYGGDYMVVSGSSIRFKITDDGSTIIGSDLSDYVSNDNEFQVVGDASFSGVVTAPTAPAGTNTTQVATTAFVQAGLNLKSNLSDITLQRAYDTSTDKKIQTLAISPFTLKAQTAAASDNVFVIENSSGFEVASVGAQGKLSAISASVEGNVTGNVFIKRSTPANNILLAGGGDLAQSTFALASSVHNPVTIGTANGLSLSNQVLSLGLAGSGVTGALSGTDWNTFNGKFNTPTGLTTNYLPKWNGSDFVDSSWQEFAGGRLSNTGNDDLTNKLQVDGSGKFSGIMNAKSYKADFNNSTANFIAEFDNLDNGVTKTKILYGAVDQPPGTGVYHNIFTKWNNAFGTILSTATYDGGGQDLFIKSKYDGTWSNWNKIVKENTDGTISASPATTANQVVVKSQLDAVATRPYKVYTALLSQIGYAAPIATVLENALGGTVVWSRTGTGVYTATLNGAFPLGKTTVMPFFGTINGGVNLSQTISGVRFDNNSVGIRTSAGSTLTDVLLLDATIEIRVYN